MHPIAAADERNEVPRQQIVLLHMISDSFNRVRQVERVMPPLPRLDQGDQHIQPVALRAITTRAHQPFDLLQGTTIVALGFDRCDVHDPMPSNVLCVYRVVLSMSSDETNIDDAI